MMQMRMGMQLGQSLGGSLFGGSGTSNQAPAKPPTYYNPLISPPPPVQTPVSPTPTSGTSAIDQLIASLGETPATPGSSNTGGTNISVATTSVGQLENPPSNSALVEVNTLSTSSLEEELSTLTGQLNA